MTNYFRYGLVAAPVVLCMIIWFVVLRKKNYQGEMFAGDSGGFVLALLASIVIGLGISGYVLGGSISDPNFLSWVTVSVVFALICSALPILLLVQGIYNVCKQVDTEYTHAGNRGSGPGYIIAAYQTRKVFGNEARDRGLYLIVLFGTPLAIKWIVIGCAFLWFFLKRAFMQP